MFLMPSRYEPCGLAQMIAMRYGCVPVVHATGGLKDTVHEGKTGFLFQAAEAGSMLEALRRALSVYARPGKVGAYSNAMACRKISPGRVLQPSMLNLSVIDIPECDLKFGLQDFEQPTNVIIGSEVTMKTRAIILAGGEGARLSVLTAKRTKPAVPFAGKYRIIDFPLSNCVNSNIFDVMVLAQYRPQSLIEHIGSGGPWDLNRDFTGGIRILTPYQSPLRDRLVRRHRRCRPAELYFHQARFPRPDPDPFR